MRVELVSMVFMMFLCLTLFAKDFEITNKWNSADFSATTRRRERAESDSQPESIGVPEYSVRVTSVARNGESVERGRLHDGMESDDDHRC